VFADLAETASKHGAAFVAVSHLNKGESLKALHRVTGSLAFVAAARAVFLVAKDQENEGQRLFVPMKNNISPDSTGCAFRVEGKDLDGGIMTSVVTWGSSAVDISANEAIASDEELVTGRGAASEFLEEELAHGPVPTKQIKKDARDAGHSWRTINRAKGEMGIVAKRRGEVGKPGYWEWGFPLTNVAPKDAKSTEECQPPKVAPFGEIGILREPWSDSGEVVV
jgi:hypothetical protein